MDEAPFDTIESAEEFMSLLAEGVEGAIDEIGSELHSIPESDKRQRQALELAMFLTNRLAFHIGRTRHCLRNLRRIRNLVHSEGNTLGRGVPRCLEEYEAEVDLSVATFTTRGS